MSGRRKLERSHSRVVCERMILQTELVSRANLSNFLTYLSEFSDVVQLVDLGSQRVEDGHVVGVLQQLLLQVLEHSQRVAEQNLRKGGRAAYENNLVSVKVFCFVT